VRFKQLAEQRGAPHRARRAVLSWLTDLEYRKRSRLGRLQRRRVRTLGALDQKVFEKKLAIAA